MEQLAVWGSMAPVVVAAAVAEAAMMAPIRMAPAAAAVALVDVELRGQAAPAWAPVVVLACLPLKAVFKSITRYFYEVRVAQVAPAGELVPVKMEAPADAEVQVLAVLGVVGTVVLEA